MNNEVTIIRPIDQVEKAVVRETTQPGGFIMNAFETGRTGSTLMSEFLAALKLEERTQPGGDLEHPVGRSAL